MPVGLDVGTAFCVCARKDQEGKLKFKKERTAFFQIEQGDFTKGLLDNNKVNYIQKDKELYILGDEALKFANLFHKEAQRPLAQGMLSPREKESVPMLRLLLEELVGEPTVEKEVIYFSVPANPVDAIKNNIYHEKVIEEILKNKGYTPKSMNEAMAIVYSELSTNRFSGIAMSFGAGMVNVAMSYLSVPILSFSIAKSGDWIDEISAQSQGETSSKMQEKKEKELDLSITQDDILLKSLAIHYDALIDYTLKHFVAEFKKSKNLPETGGEKLPIVVSGGTSMPKGFLERFKARLALMEMPIPIGNIIKASDPLNAVAKGLLIAAEV
jgi:hypothetical protein